MHHRMRRAAGGYSIRGYPDNYQRTGLVLEWLDGSLTDTSGQGNNGTNVGTSLTANQFNEVDKARFYDASENDSSYANDHASLDFSTGCSVGGYFYIDPSHADMDGQVKMIANKSDFLTSGGWYLDFDDRGGLNSIRWAVTFTDNTTLEILGSNIVTTAGYYRIFGTFDNSLGSDNLKLFINGSEVAQGNSTKTIKSNALQMRVGRANGGFGDRPPEMKVDRFFNYNIAHNIGDLP